MPESLKDVLYIRLSNEVYKKIYAIAKNHDVTMSEVGRLCIEAQMVNIDAFLKAVKDLKAGIGANK